MDANDLIEGTAGCGVFQIILTFIFFYVRCFYSWGIMFMSFGNYNPGWMCSNQSSTSNISLSNEFTTNSTAPPEEVEKDSWGNNCSALTRCEKIEFDPRTSTIVTEWGLICDKDWILAIILSVQNLGNFIGSIPAGQLAGWKGRKSYFQYSVALCALAQLLAPFSNSWQLFCVARFFIGLLIGGLQSVVFTYAQEFTETRWRAVWMALPHWNVGVALFALISWLTKNWVHIHFATAALGFLSFALLFWVPESPRWLAVQGKVKQADQVIGKMCKMNGRPPPDTDLIRQIADTEKATHNQMTQYTYLSLFQGSVSKITLVFTLLFFMFSVSYYGINFGIKALSGNLYLNMFFMAMAPVPNMFILPILANRLGRRIAFVIYIGLASAMSFSLVLVYFVAPEGIKGTTTTVLAILSTVCITEAWSVGVLLMIEIYPTVVRSLGVGLHAIAAGCGSILAPFFIPKDFDSLYISFTVVGVLLLLCCLLVSLLPETQNKPLPETLE